MRDVKNILDELEVLVGRMTDAEHGEGPYADIVGSAVAKIKEMRNKKIVVTSADDFVNAVKDAIVEVCPEELNVEIVVDNDADLCVNMRDVKGLISVCISPTEGFISNKAEELVAELASDDLSRRDLARFIEEKVKNKANPKKEEDSADNRQSDVSDEELERIAFDLDRMSSSANNHKTAYKIELAAAELRELKRGA